MKKAFVNSIPKSGTNLVAKCLTLFGYRERGHISAGTLLDSRPMALVRRITWRASRDNYQLGINSPIPARRSAVDRFLKRVGPNQFLTAHVGYSTDLLETCLEMGFVPIQVVRDPRAILASFVPYVLGDRHHFLHALFRDMDTDQRYQVVYEGISQKNGSLRSLATCCRALDPWIDHPQVFRVRFEDIVGSAGGGDDAARLEVLHQLAALLEAPENKIEEVAKKLYGPGRHTFRKGRIDAWRDEVPEELQRRITNELGDILAKWGYAP